MYRSVVTYSRRFVLVVLAVIVGAAPTVSAKTTYEFRSLNDVLWYEEGCSPTSDTTATPATTPTDDKDKTKDEKIAKILIPLFDSSNKDGALTAIEKYKFGGMAMTGNSKAFDKAFFDDAKSKAGGSFLPMADEEGGQVARYGIANKAASELGTMSAEDVKKEGQRVAEGLKGYGIEVDLAPVLDIQYPGVTNHLNMGSTSRAFGTDAKTVTEKAGAFAEGLNAGGIKPVYKHFPGLGRATANTDHAAATLDYGQLGNDLQPFKDLANKNSALVMLSNAKITGLGGNDGTPAPTNPKLIEKLRGEVGFSGTIITDDLKPVSEWSGSNLPDTVANSLKAGADLMLFTYPGEAVTDQIIEKIKNDVPDDRVNEAYGKYQSAASSSKTTPSSTTTPSSDGCSCLAGGGGTVALEGKDNTEKILKFFMSKGLSLAQAAGFVGNMMQESGLNPAIIQGGAIADDSYKPQDGVGFGLVQWTFTSRQQPLVDLAKEKNKKITDLDLQLEYVWKEVNAGYKGTLEALKKTQDPVEAAVIVHGPPSPGYEASADSPDKVREVRGGNAKKVYDKYKDSGMTSSADTGSGDSGGCTDTSGSTAPMSEDCAALVAKYKQLRGSKLVETSSKEIDNDLANCTTNPIECGTDIGKGGGVNPKLLRAVIAVVENSGGENVDVWNMNTRHPCDGLNHPHGKASDLYCLDNKHQDGKGGFTAPGNGNFYGVSNSGKGPSRDKCNRMFKYLYDHYDELGLTELIWNADTDFSKAGQGKHMVVDGHDDHIHIGVK